MASSSSGQATNEDGDEQVTSTSEVNGHPISMNGDDGVNGGLNGGMEHLDNGDNGGHAGATTTTTGEEDRGDDIRRGTINSARFNVLSTMVGGGCLSLPLAFQQSGNGFIGPIILLIVALISDFCFRLLVASSIVVSGQPDFHRPGKDSFESITSIAFGSKAYIFSMILVTLMCFFGAVGYSVLLRDMMEPINDMITPYFGGGTHDDDDDDNNNQGWLVKNFTMFVIIFLVTPACTLSNFTALKNCGAASMFSILILGSCIVYRSVQCNIDSDESWYNYKTFFPESYHELLDAAPLYISCFVCHYNILPVHNELQRPTQQRVSWWLRSTTWFATTLYIIMGFAGSAYGHCTTKGHVQGNVLLDFDENDPLLMVGRMCLAVTITLAFPMLVIPARDILLRSLILPCLSRYQTNNNNSTTISESNLEEGPPINTPTEEELRERLLAEHSDDWDGTVPPETTTTSGSTVPGASFTIRLVTAIVIFWSGASVASCVQSIDIVWDLLGSSLSILLSYLIPCGCYLAITKNDSTTTTPNWKRSASRFLAWILILFFTPLMFVSTGNAIVNTFGS